MHIAEIDQISVNTVSAIHRKNARSKCIFALLNVMALMTTTEVYKLVAINVIVLMVIYISNVSIKRVLHLAMYPAFFSLLFAAIGYSNGPSYSLAIILKAMGSAITMLFLITTTPYVDIFSLFSKFMPSLLVDVFFVTYRSFFILMEKLEHTLLSVKLRGGYRSWRIGLNIKTLASVFGTVLMQSIEMSERMYKIYMLRGYNGKMPALNEKKFDIKEEWPLIALGIMTLVGVNISWNL